MYVRCKTKKIDKLVNNSFDCCHYYAIRNESCSNNFFEFKYTTRKCVLRFAQTVIVQTIQH